jgi:uncharacterized protein YjiS (DUF1127 family)
MRAVFHAPLTTMIDAAARWLRAVAQRYQIARAEKALHAMEDRMLSDIGVSRGNIASAVRGGRPRD